MVYDRKATRQALREWERSLTTYTRAYETLDLSTEGRDIIAGLERIADEVETVTNEIATHDLNAAKQRCREHPNPLTKYRARSIEKRLSRMYSVARNALLLRLDVIELMQETSQDDVATELSAEESA